MIKRNEGFTCAHCSLEVAPLDKSCRNHCPRCLYSRHVDIVAGDREADCGGLMAPVAVEVRGGRYWLTHRCLDCGLERRARAAPYAQVQPDHLEAIIQVMQGPRRR